MSHPLAELILDSPRLWPLALLCAIISILAVWWLYDPQVKSLQYPWRWLLPALRSGALLVLAVSFLRPVAVHPASGAEAGAILVLVDNSRSMSARDLAYLATPENPSPLADLGISHLVAVADGLGELNPGTRDPALITLRDDLRRLQSLQQDWSRARGELDFARVSGQGLDAARARLRQADELFRDAALQIVNRAPTLFKPGRAAQPLYALARFSPDGRRLPLQDAAGPVAAAIRWADAAQITQDVALYRADNQVRALCDQLAATSRFQRVQMALTAPRVGLLGKFPADVPLFGFTVAQDIQPLPLRGADQPVRRLLAEPSGLESDLAGGVQTAISRFVGAPLQAVILISDGRQVGGDPTAASTLATADVPIFTVYAAGPTDLLLRDVSVADLSLPSSAFPGETLTARVVLRSSGMDQYPTTVSLAVDDAPPTTRPITLSNDLQTLEFPLRFDTPGVHHVVASIPSPPDAPSNENKRLDRWVKVMADRLNTGLYAGAPTLDFQLVADALSRTPWITLHKEVFTAGAARLDLTPRQILDLDLLILFDVPYSALSPAQWNAVHQLVTDRGGRVLLVAGNKHIPAEYALHPQTAALLPYLPAESPVWRDWPGKDPGFHAQPADTDFLHLQDNTAASQDQWAALPPFSRYLSLPPLKRAAQPLLMERDSSSPLLVETRVGSGRAFFMAMNETWRWRGQGDQNRFWLQLVRYAAQPPYAVHTGNVWLDADPVAAAPSQSIHIRARVFDSSQNPSKALTQTAELDKDGRLFAKVVLTRGVAAGQYQATLRDLPEGNYQLSFSPPDGAHPARFPLRVAASDQAEMADLSGNPQFMRRLAEASGGSFLTLDQIGALPDLIRRSQTSENPLARQPLWDSSYLYALVVACFAAEWAIRKRLGLI